MGDCQSCGFEVVTGDLYCTNCGVKIDLPQMEKTAHFILYEKFMSIFAEKDEDKIRKNLQFIPPETIILQTRFIEIPMKVLKTNFESEVENMSHLSLDYIEHNFTKAIVGGYYIQLAKRILNNTYPFKKVQYQLDIQKLSDEWQEMMSNNELEQIAESDEVIAASYFGDRLEEFLSSNEEILGMSVKATDYLAFSVDNLIKRGIFLGYLEQENTR